MATPPQSQLVFDPPNSASRPDAFQGGLPKIEIESASHRFRSKRGDVHVLDTVSLSIGAGAFVSIVGPSGCGKSTLLNVIAGLVSPDDGTVRIDGRPVQGIQQIVGYMFARDCLLPWRTAIENVEFGLEIRNVRERRSIAAQSLEAVGLSGFEHHYRHQLSQGMRQRVAVARTFAVDPEILLMDEPFGALDAQTRMLLQDMFLRIWEQKHKTVVFVTHDLIEAIVLSDTVVVMSQRPGRIKRILPIDLPRPRSATALHLSGRFQELYETLWAELRAEVDTR